MPLKLLQQNHIFKPNTGFCQNQFVRKPIFFEKHYKLLIFFEFPSRKLLLIQFKHTVIILFQISLLPFKIITSIYNFTKSKFWMRTLSSARKTDQANFTDWMSILPSNLMEEISPNTAALRANTLSQFVSKKI